MNTRKEYEQLGYLNEDFKMFHIVDHGTNDIAFHYHNFHKILICLDGDLSYCIEGRTYQLEKNDIVFVSAGEVHRPIAHSNHIYDRIIIYVSKDYLSKHKSGNDDLSLCLQQAHEKQSHVLRIPSFNNGKLGNIMRDLENALKEDDFANDLYRNLLFLEFMVQLNRAAQKNAVEYLSTTSSNDKVVAIIDYLNKNLTKEISIDSLADQFYISRYYLMHSFKEATGYTIGNYITTKRLLLAKELIHQGMAVTDACYESGFHSYSTFSRAYKKTFGFSPTNS